MEEHNPTKESFYEIAPLTNAVLTFSALVCDPTRNRDRLAVGQSLKDIARGMQAFFKALGQGHGQTGHRQGEEQHTRGRAMGLVHVAGRTDRHDEQRDQRPDSQRHPGRLDQQQGGDTGYEDGEDAADAEDGPAGRPVPGRTRDDPVGSAQHEPLGGGGQRAARPGQVGKASGRHGDAREHAEDQPDATLHRRRKWCGD